MEWCILLQVTVKNNKISFSAFFPSKLFFFLTQPNNSATNKKIKEEKKKKSKWAKINQHQ